MTFAPMLSLEIDINKLEPYIEDDLYWFEQKLDGRRLLITQEGGRAVARNRSGDPATIDPRVLEPVAHLNRGKWYFDGEWIDNQFWLFDMPYALEVVNPETSYEDRRLALETVYASAFTDTDLVRLIDVSRTCEEKRALLDWCRTQGSEGVMVKSRKGKYAPGKRTAAMMKAKFTTTADCIIGEVRREGKLSSSLFMYRDGNLIEIGYVKMTDRDLDRAKIGDVVEIKYLYCTRDYRLYQPRFKGFRDDKNPHECTTDTLQFVDKTIRQLERQDLAKKG